MVSLMNTVDTAHEDMVHDAQLDYYGTKLATCSSDRKVKIFDVANNQQTLVIALEGHEGPVWQVAWSHPMYGSLLASCGYDKKVIIWQETDGKWNKLYENCLHESSVNSICWAPYEIGLILACGSSDGSISIISSSGDGNWDVKKITSAHSVGCNAVSWAPAIPQSALLEQPDGQQPRFVQKLVSGGSDGLVKIWKLEGGQWIEDCKLDGHYGEWIRDVAWAPSIGLPRSKIASCSQDGRIIIWTNTASTPESTGGSTNWEPCEIQRLDDIAWSVSWSLTGNILAVAGADNAVHLWKESPDGTWTNISSMAKGRDNSGVHGS